MPAYSIRYNAALAQQHVDLPLPFDLFGRSGGYGRTRSELVAAVREGNHFRARELFTKLVLEGISDDAGEQGCTLQHAHNELVKLLASEPTDPLYFGFLVPSI